MPVTIANRATIASLGSTAALLAAVVAVSLVVGGLVAYSGSPAGPLIAGEPRLVMPGSAADASISARQTARPLVLPAAGRAATTVPAASAGRASRARTRIATPAPGPAPTTGSARPATPLVAGPAPVTGSGQIIPATTPPAGLLPSVPSAPAVTSGLADTTTALGRTLGGTVRGTVGIVGAVVGQVSPSLGHTVDGLGVGLGGTVAGTTDGVAGLLRRLVG